MVKFFEEENMEAEFFVLEQLIYVSLTANSQLMAMKRYMTIKILILKVENKEKSKKGSLSIHKV